MSHNTPRPCKKCGKLLERKRFNHRWEDLSKFLYRRYCSKKCGANDRAEAVPCKCRHCHKVTMRKPSSSHRPFCNWECWKLWKVGRAPRPIRMGAPVRRVREKKVKPAKAKVSMLIARTCPCGVVFQVRPNDARTYHSPACLLEHL